MRFAALLLLVPSTVVAGNYAACLVDELPGVENDAAAMAVAQMCQERHPGGMNAVMQGSGRSWLGYDSGAECAAKESRETRSYKAAAGIRYACDRLYDLPTPAADFDPRTARPVPDSGMFGDLVPKR